MFVCQKDEQNRQSCHCIGVCIARKLHLVARNSYHFKPNVLTLSKILALKGRRPCNVRRLESNLGELSALCASQGLSLTAMALKRPDILLQSSISLQRKLSSLPEVLGITPKRARELVADSPQLLRR